MLSPFGGGRFCLRSCVVRALFLFCFSFVCAFAQFFQGQPPTGTRPVKTFNYTYYAVGYSDETRTPLWSAMEVRQAGEPILGCKRAGKFAPEPRAEPQIFHTDYKNSDGYSRGHLTPNAVVAYVHGCEAAKATFVTSNIVPQLQSHNGGVWEALEAAIGGRNSGSGFVPGLVQKVPDVWIYTGPVFWGGVEGVRKLGPKEVWVPSALWKTVIWRNRKGRTRTCSWVIPHREGIPKNSYMDYVVSMKEIEEQAGIRILATDEEGLSGQIDAPGFLDPE